MCQQHLELFLAVVATLCILGGPLGPLPLSVNAVESQLLQYPIWLICNHDFRLITISPSDDLEIYHACSFVCFLSSILDFILQNST